jgi:hypothetical protein
MSNYRIPLEQGDPLKEGNGPSFYASSIEAVHAAKYIVSNIFSFT